MTAAPPLLQVDDLVVQYTARRRRSVTAVDHVDLSIDRGRTLGLVGESGSGKSSIGSVILGLVGASSGRVLLDGSVIDRRRRADRQRLAQRIQVIFQDPFGSMNPTRTVGETLGEQLRFGLKLGPTEIADRLERALVDVSMARPGHAAEVLARYPGQFSGGQLQRLAIARAIAAEPDFIVCDEAVSALDLSVQAQVINLLERLARDRGLAYLFISHDLSVVRHISDEIAVLFAGQVVERGPAELVADSPAHPYTRSLLLAAPVPDPAIQTERRRARREARRLRSAASDGVGSGSASSPDGCPYSARCPFVVDVCRSERPALLVRDTGVAVACHRYGEIPAAVANTAPVPSQDGRGQQGVVQP